MTYTRQTRYIPWITRIPLFIGIVLIGIYALTPSSGISLAAHASEPSAYSLHLINDRTEETLLTLPLEEGEEVIYRYVHSVEEMPVEEMLRVEDGALWSVGSRSERFGLGHMPRAGTLHADDSAQMRADGYRHEVTDMVMFTGTADSPNMELLYRNKKTRLSQEFPSLHLRWSIQRATRYTAPSQQVEP